MEVANILDIDGSQWEIQDVEARNEIVTLKTEIEKLKTIEKWEYTIPTYGGEIIARRQGNIVNITANRIGRTNPIPDTIGNMVFAVLPERFRPSFEQFYMMRLSGSYQTNIGGTIAINGAINFYTYRVIEYGSFTVSYIVD